MSEGVAKLAFFRIVQMVIPVRRDFESHRSLGKVLLNPTPEKVRLWRGVSAYRTQALARRKALDYPQLGRYIAEMSVAADGPIRWERTGGRGHFTLWGTPDDLLATVVTVVEV